MGAATHHARQCNVGTRWRDDLTQIAAAPAASISGAALETVTVTSSKISGDVQNIPISITAMSQEQLTATQTTGGPDLVKQVPNLTFSKTNFTGYNIQIRGIGTQAISVTTDPAVAVSFNDIPFLRNHFFEQEFFDVSQVEVLRGPQGTLYGRNATSGVVNLVSARPSDQYEAMGSVDVGNYNNRRLEGMLNIPVFGDMLDLRAAGEWTKRDGYSFNEETGHSTDGRDLWSSRASLLFRPTADITATGIWEHFQEDDDRLRSGKQLCARDEAPSVINGPAGPQIPDANENGNYGAVWLEQGCHGASLYSPESYGTPNAASIPFIAALELLTPYMTPGTNPYAGVTQSPNLRVIDSLIGSAVPRKERHVRIQHRLSGDARAPAFVANGLQSGQSFFDGRFQPLQHRDGNFRGPRREYVCRTGSGILRSAAQRLLQPGSWRRIFPRKRRSSSIRKCVLARRSTAISIFFSARII